MSIQKVSRGGLRERVASHQAQMEKEQITVVTGTHTRAIMRRHLTIC